MLLVLSKPLRVLSVLSKPLRVLSVLSKPLRVLSAVSKPLRVVMIPEMESTCLNDGLSQSTFLPKSPAARDTTIFGYFGYFQRFIARNCHKKCEIAESSLSHKITCIWRLTTKYEPLTPVRTREKSLFVAKIEYFGDSRLFSEI